MDKKTIIAALVVAVVTLMLAGRIRSSVPFANKIPTL
jgi:hypothetical protein